MIKAIVSSVSATVMVVTLGASLLFNSILGVFNLAVVSADTLSNLKSSKQVVQQMKTRHSSKKANVTKRYMKKTGRRVASGAVAASTIGTVAVVSMVAGMEILDYCDEQEELQVEENILYGEAKEFEYETCVAAAKQDSQEIMESLLSDSSVAVKDAWDSTKQYSNETWAEVRQMSTDTLNSALSTASEYWESLTELVLDSHR